MEKTMIPADSVIERAVKTYGEESQLWMVIEEMSELAKEICKYKRGMNNPEAMAEEIADVQIMIEQAKIIFGNSRRVNECIEYKLNRLERRLDEVKGNDARGEAAGGDEASGHDGNPACAEDVG